MGGFGKRSLLLIARFSSGTAAVISGIRVFEKLTDILLIEPVGMPAPNPIWTSLSIFVLNTGIFFYDRVRADRALRVIFQTIALATCIASIAAVSTHFTSFQPPILHRTRLPGVVTLSLVSGGTFMLLTSRLRDLGVVFGLAVTIIASMITLGVVYGGTLVSGVTIPTVSPASALGGVLTGIGMVTCAGLSSWLIKPFVGESVRAILLRWLLPTSAFLILVTDFTTVRVFTGFSSALGSGINTAISMLVTALVVSYVAAILAKRLESAAAERFRLEQELRQVQKMHTVGQLAGGIAHDFNNLLGVISASGNLALNHVSPASPAHDELKDILTAADRGSDLTRQLLTFSRKQVVTPKDVDLNEVVRRASRMLRRLIGNHIEVKVVTCAEACMVRADVGQIEQVLFNLAANARDAMPNGGRIVIATKHLEADRAFVAGHAEAVPGQYCVFSVSDTGTGMTKEVVERIFEPFFTTKDASKGTGLGLATVFGIVHQSGGFIDVDTALQRGTTFTVYLPRLNSVELANERATAEDERKPPLLLLVEDEAPIRRFARTTLQRAGYDVLEASNASEALEKWSAYRNAICVVVTDLHLPGEMSGLDVAAQIQSEEQKLRVVFTTGDPQTSEMQIGGTRSYLPKPYTPAQLLDVVHRSCALA